MARNTSQLKRTARLDTALGRDVLLLRQFDGTDHVDDLFEYTVEAQCDTDKIMLDDLIGTHATVVIEETDHGTRYFDGIVTAGRWIGDREDKALFRLTLEPWFKLLAQRRNQRIFHEVDVKEILQKLFEPYSGLGQPATEFNLNNNYPVLEYTVQYRESDLSFARRLMERFGLSFFFRHEQGSHTLVITDAFDNFDNVPGGKREFLKVAEGHQAREEHFWTWQKARNMTTGAIRLKDFNFKTPTAMMEVERKGDATYAEGGIESYDYPGVYLDEGQGKAVAAVDIDAERGKDHRHFAAGDCVSLGAGMKVTLTGQGAAQINDKNYLCLSASHSYSEQSYESGKGSGESTFQGSYTFVPTDETYGPAKVTPLAVVHGPQTATVVGDGEIDCDEFGRILVLFHWDLEKVNSMRCRVSQNWAGNGWGGMVIPRIGMEVVVEFLEGDPDKPLVTGCVYNGKNDVPYKLPENKTRSTFRSDTHKGQGFNEFRFEDEKDEEEVYLHAQKDMNTKIRNNRTSRVNVNEIESVGNSRGVEIGNMDTEVVVGDKQIFVGPSQKGRFSPGGDDDQGIGGVGYQLGNPGTEGSGNFMLNVEANRNAVVADDDTLEVGKNRNEVIDKDYYTTVKKKYVLDVGDQITIKCGQSMITLKKNGDITINGKQLNVKMNSLIKMASSMIKMN